MTLRTSIDVAEPVYTGEPFRVVVTVETTSPRVTRGVSLLLRGFTTLSTRVERKTPRETFGAWSALLVEAAHLDRGVHRFEGTLVVPDDAPPSGSGGVQVFYQLDARVKLEVPWVFDSTATRRLPVARRTRVERPPPRPVTARSAAHRKDALFLELTLDDVTFAPGESIRGAFSLANIGRKRADTATISLVPARPDATGGHEGVSILKSLVGVMDGGVIRFTLPLPATTSLSFASRTLDVAQAVQLRVDGSPETCRIPIVIDTFAPRREEPKTSALVGQTRWRFDWDDEGTRAGLTLEDRELSLRGTLAGEAFARVSPRGRGVHASLRWESLGIGLSVTPRAWLPSGVSLDQIDPVFAGRFVARGREAAQVLAALGPDLRAALLAFDEAELDDTGARVTSSASARDPEELRRFLVALDTLAEAIVAAERRLPPPSWLEPESAEAWRAFAVATTGRLHAGRMAVTGARINSDRIDVETRCDAQGRPRQTRLTLILDPPADRLENLPEGAEADLTRKVHDRARAPHAEIRSDAIVLDLNGAIANPGALREAMDEMTRLSRRLRGEMSRGPYR